MDISKIRFYKHTKREWVEQSSFKLGTLKEYRDVIAFSDGIVDSGQGETTHTRYVDEINMTEGSLNHPGLIVEGATNFTVRDACLSNTYFLEHDTYIFCVTTDPSKELRAKLDPEYDCTYEIIDLREFMNMLNYFFRTFAWTELKNEGFFVECEYGERHTYSTTNSPEEYNKSPRISHPAVSKKHEDAYQAEWRMVWDGGPYSLLKPLYLTIPKMQSAIRLLD